MINTTLHIKLKSDHGMLPQSHALEVSAADKPRVGAKRADTCAVTQHCQGERHTLNKCSRHSRTSGKGSVRTVFVLNSKGRPIMPTAPARARQLLKQGQARIHKLVPFTIRLTDREEAVTQPIIIKVDPGSKTTGIALVRANHQTHHLLHASELTHQGAAIAKSMQQRKNYRRRRRSANLRYRAPRFNNRTRKAGWLPPSTYSRVEQTINWIKRYKRLVPVTEVWIESVKFDTQKLQNPEISGTEYQQGTLHGYEVREYLLEKWHRKCAYCDAKDLPLQIEHIIPKARGGSNRISNLTLACPECNEEKDATPVTEFVKDTVKLQAILTQAKAPLRDAAAINVTRHAIVKEATALNLPVATFSGGMTKWNRSRLGIPKTHALDAACVGNVVALLAWDVTPVLQIKATGRGSYQRTLVNKYGFPRGYLMRTKSVQGFQTGDHVRAVVPKGKRQGTYVGRAAVRARGIFNIQTARGTVTGISHKHCRLLQHADGYQYQQQRFTPNLTEVGVPSLN